MCTSNRCHLESMVFDLKKRIDKLEREIWLRDMDLSKRIREDYMFWIKILMHEQRAWYSNCNLKIKKDKELDSTA